MKYKALRTNFTEEELKLTWKEWLWSECPYWFRKFIRKFRRWRRYSTLLWRMPSWNEYTELIQVIRLQLEIMAQEFEKSQITVSSDYDANKMKLIAKLLKIYSEEYYENKHFEEAHDSEKWEKAREMDFEDFLNFDTYKEGYDFKYIQEGSLKDEKALRLACALLSHHLPGWWQ